MRLLTRPVLATLLALSSCIVQAHTQGAAAPEQALKVFTMARTSPFESLDPPRQFSLGSNDIGAITYNTLLRYSYLARPYKLEADLVERMPELSADGLTYTFRLRRGIHFHDSPCFHGGKGRETNADDMLFSLGRYADGRVNNKSWFAMEGAVAGLDAWRATTTKPAPSANLLATAIPSLQSSFIHPGCDRAFGDARHMADGPARLALFREMNTTLLDEAPILLNYSPLRVSVMQKWLRNFKRNLMQPEFEFLDSDLAHKAPRS